MTRSRFACWLTVIGCLAGGCAASIDDGGATISADPADATSSAITLHGTSRTALDQATGPGNALVLARPPQLVAGDLILVEIATYASVAVAPPDGFSTVLDQTATGHTVANGSLRSIVFRRVAGANEPGSYSFTLDQKARGVGFLHAFANVDGVSPIDAKVSAIASAASATQSTPRISTTVPGAVLIGIFGAVSPHEPASSTSQLATKLGDASSGNAGSWGVQLGVYSSAPRPAAGDQGTRTVTLSSATDTATMALVALAPRHASGPYRGPKIWGASDQLKGGPPDGPGAETVEQLRADLIADGSTLNGYRSYHNQSDGASLNKRDVALHNAGAMLVTHVRTNVGAESAWANIARGDYDAAYDALFKAMLDLDYGDGHPVPTNSIFTLDAEFDRFLPGARVVHGTTAEFIAAWTHLYDRLRHTGPNAKHPNNARLLFGFAPTDWGFWHSQSGTLQQPGLDHADRVSPMWPGDAYVDILTPDAYNKASSWGNSDPVFMRPQWHTMGALFDEARTWTTNSGHGIGKQILIVEGDCMEFGTSRAPWDKVTQSTGPFPAGSSPDKGAMKQAWFEDGGDYIRSHADIVGFLYWNVDYPPNTTPAAYEGWKTGAAAALR